MKLPPRTLNVRRIVVKEKPVLALDTGIEADSIEGLRLVKASRGTGWVRHAGVLKLWTTKGVLQENKKLVVWGDLPGDIPEGQPSGEWPRAGAEGWAFLRAFTEAWTSRAEVAEPMDGFSSSAVVPFQTSEGWAFLFPPPDLKSVLDSLHPLTDRLAWDHFRHPDAPGPEGWAFASAALAVEGISGTLPWGQDDEAHLKQEIRDLKRTLSRDELPTGEARETVKLWYDSLGNRLGPQAVARWKAWVADPGTQAFGPGDEKRIAVQERYRNRREKSRARGAFWRRRGGLILGVGLGCALILSIVGSVVWGLVKPDPTDTWTPEQVVQGYYLAIDHLDTETLRKITSYDKGKEPNLGWDQDLVVNLYVIRQVRTGYERKNPVVSAETWESGGKPALDPESVLFGVSGLTVAPEGDGWVAKYHLWETLGTSDSGPRASGKSVVDHLGLIKTWKGWKVSSLRRESEPLP